jgi:uncharacterized membrane protein
VAIEFCPDPACAGRLDSRRVVATLYEWLLFLHILAAMVWIGGLAALSLFGVSVLRNHDREAVARFVGDLRVVGPMLLAPSSVLVVGLGIWMVADDEAWGFGQTWIWLALALVGTAVLVGAVFLSRYAGRSW